MTMETQSLGRESGCSMLLSPCLCGLGSLETWSGLELLSLDSDTFEEVVIWLSFQYSEKATKANDKDTSIVYSYTYPLRIAIFLKKWFYSWIDKKKVLYFTACPLWPAWWESVCKKKDGWMTGRYMRRPVARRDSRLQDAAVCSVSAGCAPPVTGNVSHSCHTRVTCH